MIIYSKNKKLYGSINSVPTSADEEILYMDKEQNRIHLNTTDTYLNDGRGGIIRRSDGKNIDVYIDDFKIIPSNTLQKPKKPNFIKHSDFLYEISFEDIDYKYAEHYFKWDDKEENLHGMCTSAWNNGMLYRNFDWYYNNDVAFVTRVSAKEDAFYVKGKRFASVGIADSIPGLTKDFVNSDYYAGGYKLIPFRTVDGINEKGLGVSMNVVPIQKGDRIETTPTVERKYDIQGSQLTRFILDNFETAEEAIDYIKKYVAIYANKALKLQGYDLHYLITDIQNAFIVEIINDNIVSKKVDSNTEIKPIITNFHVLQDLEATPIVLDSGHVYTPADVKAGKLPSSQGITSHGSGLERYNLVVDNYENLSDFRNLVLYNKAYYTWAENPNPWYSEFVGLYNGTEITVDTPAEIFDKCIMPSVRDIYKNRNRETANTWHTTHHTTYNIAEKSLVVFDSSESNNAYNFKLEV